MAFEYQSYASLGLNLNRQKYGPLDISNVFTSENDLKYYLTKGTHKEGVSEYWTKATPYPYEGQVLATVIDGVVEVFVLALDAEGNFETREIGAKVEVDGKTIKLNDAGKLELVGLPTDIAGKTLVPSLVNGELTWAEPDTSTAEGQAQEIEGLKTRATALEATVNGTGEGDEHVAGLVEKVAALEAVDNATQAELDAYKDVVTAAIAAGVKEAKDYADAQDADTVYDDTDLQNRVAAIEGDYLKEADKYDDTEVRELIADLDEAIGDAENGLVKDIADNKAAIETEKTRAEAAEADLLSKINAIDFIDAEELAAGVKEAKDYTDAEIDKIEEAISNLNHFTTKVVTSIDEVTDTGVLYLIKDESVSGVDKYNEYIVVDGSAVLIGDTTTDLSNYYNKTEINSKVETIEGAIADEVEAREALAEKVTALEDVDNATQAELDAYKLEVTEAIRVAKEAAISDADGKLANKVNSSDFETFKGENTTAIGTAKSEAIAAAKTETETQVGDLRDDVAETYATKTELSEAVEGIENDLLAYAKTADVNSELAKKIETATISHSTEEKAEGVTKSGTQLDIVVDAFTKAETRQYVADTIKTMTGGESAADVKLLLENHIADYEEKVGQIDAKDAAQDTSIAKAQGDATKGIEDAAKVASDLNDAELLIAANARAIETVKGTITTVNETLSGKVTALENKDTEIAGQISGLDTTVKGHTTTITEHGTKITALENEDLRLAGLIQGNTDKFANYSDTAAMNKAIEDAIAAIPATDLSKHATIEYVDGELAKKANAADVYTKAEADDAFMTEGEVDARINALIVAADPEGGKTITDIQNLVKYVDENAGEIAALVTEVDNHAAQLAGFASNETVKGYVDDAIDDAIAAIVMPKASTEVTIAEDGTLGIGEVSTDKIVNGVDTFVIDGGDSTK